MERSIAPDDVHIRPLADDDADELAAAISLSHDHMSPWMPWVNKRYGPADAFGFIRRTRADGSQQCAIILDGKICGGVGVNQINVENGSGNLGYWVAAGHTGQGLASMAGLLMARRAINRLRLHRLQVTMSVENIASQTVAEKMGAHYEGVARGALLLRGRFHDAHVYSLLATDVITESASGRQVFPVGETLAGPD